MKATEEQTVIVNVLRDLIRQKDFGLEEIINKEKWMKGYLMYVYPGVGMIYALGLTASNTVTFHVLPLYGQKTKYEAVLSKYRSGKSCLRFKYAKDIPTEILSEIILNGTEKCLNMMQIHLNKRIRK